MTGVISSAGGIASVMEAYQSLFGWHRTGFSLESVKATCPFLRYSSVFSTYLQHVTASEPFLSRLQTISPNTQTIQSTPRAEENRSAPITYAILQELRTNIQLAASSMSRSEAMNYIENLKNGLRGSIITYINDKCYSAMVGSVTISNVMLPNGDMGIINRDADSDGVGIIDATTTGFDLSVMTKIPVEFAKNTQNNAIDTSSYYLVLPEAAKAKFLDSATVVQSVDYHRDLELERMTQTIRGAPVFTPKAGFFKPTKVKIGSTTKDCVLGFAVLNGGLTIGYQEQVGMIMSNYFPKSEIIESDHLNMAPSMFGIYIKDLGIDRPNGFGLTTEGSIGVVRSFTGSVVRIALPVDNIA